MDLLTGSHSTKRMADYPRRIRDVWDEWKPESESRQLSNTAIAGAAALVLVVAAGIYYGPDFVRYLRIRRM